MNKENLSIEYINELFSLKKYDHILKILLPFTKKNIIKNNIPTWNIYYIIGQCYRFKEDLKNSTIYLKLSVENNENFMNLQALGVAYQILGNYDEAIRILSRSTEINNSNFNGWNSLALTQKYLKKYDISEKNYETALQVYFRNIIKNLNNSDKSIYYKHDDRSNNCKLFSRYSIDAAVYLGITKDFDEIAFPNGDFAEKISNDVDKRSLYWIEQSNLHKKKIILFMPNFFNTIFKIISGDYNYCNILGNKSVVLKLQGKKEFKIFQEEALFFKSTFF